MPWGQCSCRLTFYGRNDESLRVAMSRGLHHHFDESVLDLDQGRLSLSNVVFAILSHAGQHHQDSPICRWYSTLPHIAIWLLISIVSNAFWIFAVYLGCNAILEVHVQELLHEVNNMAASKDYGYP